MEFEEFVQKAKQIVIEKRTNKLNVKREWLKWVYDLNHHEDYLKRLEALEPSYMAFKYWKEEQVEHHKQQILKD